MKRKFLICLVLMLILLLNSLTVSADGLTPSKEVLENVAETRESAPDVFEYIDSYDWRKEIVTANGLPSEEINNYSVYSEKLVGMYDFGHDYIKDWQDGGDNIFNTGYNIWAFPYYYLGEYSGAVVIFDRTSDFSYSIMMTNSDTMLGLLFNENTLSDLLERNNISSVQDCKILFGSYSAMPSVMYLNNSIVLCTDADSIEQITAEEKECFLSGWILDETSNGAMGGGGYTRINNANNEWYMVLVPIIAIFGVIYLMRLSIKYNKVKKGIAMVLLTVVLLNFFAIANVSPMKVSAEEITEPLKVEDIPSSLTNGIDEEDLENVTIINDTENLNSFTTVDSNGKRTAYIFNEPIKYVDEKGKVKFKSEKTVKSNKLFDTYEYYGEDNNILCYFPKKIKDGVKLEYNGWHLTFTPVTNKNSKPERTTVTFNDVTEEMIEYPEVFDKYTTLQYKPLVNGIKENIVLSQYNGRNTFEFEIDIGGLVPAYYEGESIPLLDPETNEIAFILGQVDARDSFTGENVNNDRHFTLFNSLKLTESKKGKYILTITVDKEFLESETTVYPVVIDPTVNATHSVISDTTVYSGKPTNSSYYTSSYMNVGYHNAEFGYGEGLVKITNMNSFLNISADNLLDVTYRVYEGSGYTDNTIIRLRDVSSIWNETTVNWNNKPAYAKVISDMIITSYGWKDFSLKTLFKYWLDYARGEGGVSAEYGFSLTSYTSLEVDSPEEAHSRHFCSTEHSTYKPYIAIKYNSAEIEEGVYYIKNVESNNYLDTVDRSPNYSTSVIQDTFYGGYSQQWIIEESDIDGYYFIRPMHAPLRKFDVYDNLMENGSDIRICSDWYVGDSCRWQIRLNTHFTDGSYRIICKESGKAAVVEGASHYPGANVFQYTYTEGQDRNDDWIFEKADERRVVSLIPQAQSRWCWAACAEMMARFRSMNYTRTQHEAAPTILSQREDFSINNDDLSGSLEESAAAIEYISEGQLSAYYFENEIYDPSALTAILSGNPVRIGLDFLNSANEGTDGHAIVIYGFFYDSSGNLNLRIKNPSPENVGSEYTLSYEETCFISGRSAWQRTLVLYDAREYWNTTPAVIGG